MSSNTQVSNNVDKLLIKYNEQTKRTNQFIKAADDSIKRVDMEISLTKIIDKHLDTILEEIEE